MEYRVRYKVKNEWMKLLLREDAATASPGVIKNNLPKALKWLRVAKEKWLMEAWLEERVNDSLPWVKREAY